MSEDQKTNHPGQRRTAVAERPKAHDDPHEHPVEAELLAMLDAVLEESRGGKAPTQPVPTQPTPTPRALQSAPPPGQSAARPALELRPPTLAPLTVAPPTVAQPNAGRPRTIPGRWMMLVAVAILSMLVSWAIARWIIGRGDHAPPETGVVSAPADRRSGAPAAPAERETRREPAPGHDIAPAPGRTEAPSAPVRPVQPGQPVPPKPAPRLGSSERPAGQGAIPANPLPVPNLGAPPTTIPAPSGGVTGTAPRPSESVVPAPGKEAEPGGTERAAASALIREETAIRETLHQYQNAYEQLNASAAAAVWPSVDEKALAKAFAGLASYDLVFERCDVTVGVSTATALCRGRATYVPKVGRSTARVEPREWTFNLKHIDSEWKIETVEGRRW